MKISVNLPERDVAYLDRLVARSDLRSRSAAVHQAVGALRAHDLEAEYAAAAEEWEASEDAEAWDGTVADGLDARAAR